MLLRIVSVSAIVLSTITIPAAAASAEVVEAMSRDFGITAAQALTRIRDEKVALKIAPAAQEAAAESFGGSWYADGKLRVAVTDPAKADAVRATGAEPVLRTKSFASLNAVKNGIDRLSKAGSVSKDVAGWRVDVQRGAVVVDALPRLNAETNSVRRRHANRRRAANTQSLDGTPHILHRAAFEIYGLPWQARLVKQRQVAVDLADPMDCLETRAHYSTIVTCHRLRRLSQMIRGVSNRSLRVFHLSNPRSSAKSAATFWEYV